MKKIGSRIVCPQPIEEEKRYEEDLRPKYLKQYIGQKKHIENLNVFISAAKIRGQPLDHILFSGPPGLGKTTLAHIIANELNVGFYASSGPAIEHKGYLLGILTNLKFKDVFFIDEIHRLSSVIEENLYPALEDFKIDVVIGEGPYARTAKLDIERFTLVGATTRSGLLTSPLRSRFGIMIRLDFYPPEDLFQIVLRSAQILGIAITQEGAWEIAVRARGTPRIANRLLKRIYDFATVKAEGKINKTIAIEALQRLDVDEKGLDDMDRKLLRIIIEKFSGGPVGIETLAIAINESKDTIEDVYEPFLIQGGWLKRTPRGRVTTSKAYKHLGLETPRTQGNLF
jgi:Holliday junction DNA helicase RuvB